MISITQRRVEDIESSLAGSFHCTIDPSTLIGVTVAEHLRAMIFGAALPQKDSTAPRTIHTTRLMTSTRRVVELLWPKHACRSAMSDGQSGPSDICSAILQRLGTLGDAVDIGQRQWMATPLRIVAPDDCPSLLLVGTAPVPAARQMIGTEATCAGATRFLGQRVLDILGQRVLDSPNNQDIAQSVDAWLGEIPPLHEWTAQVLVAHEARMDVMQDLSAEQLEIYAPDVLRSQRRPGRWIAAGQIDRPLGGVRLCQPQGRYARSYDTPQYLAHFEFRNDALSLRRCVSINRDLTLRLRFGLDLLLHTPREFSIAHAGQTFRVDRRPALPQPEERIYALGWEDRNVSEPSDRLIFHRDALPIVTYALQRLSITPSITPPDFP
jgi:hypothetical protein